MLACSLGSPLCRQSLQFLFSFCWRAICAGCHRGGDFGCHFELIRSVGDVVTMRDKLEISVCYPNLTRRILEHEHPNWPIETRIRARREKLNPKWWVSKHQQH